MKLHYCLLIYLLLPLLAKPQVHPIDASKARQFDFWVGQWDVNLRIRQQDNTWEDKVRSEARIYKILQGKGILELWSQNEGGIIGYSFRYYREETDEWELWLNWPGNNRCGTTSLSGAFRHGRGDFYSYRPMSDSTERITRYGTASMTLPRNLSAGMMPIQQMAVKPG